MRRVILTCAHHPELRWSCKQIAFSGNGYGYNGSRSISFLGFPSGKGMFKDGSGLDCTIMHPETGELAVECTCSPRALILAPEDKLVAREEGGQL